MQRVLYVIMAGGRGERLRPLTFDRPKPLVRFGATARIIDFTLLNCLASGCGELLVLTQYLSDMVEKFLHRKWRAAFEMHGVKLEVLAGKDSYKACYLGTADAVFQALVKREGLPEYTMVLAGDHVYRMDYRPMINYHLSHGGAVTVGAVKCDRGEAHRFGVIEARMDGSIRAFHEKPGSLCGIAPAGRKPLASMGIYVFTTRELLRYLELNQDEDSHDFGRDVVPEIARDRKARVYNFQSGQGRRGYWRDVGDLASYWRTSMDVLNGRRQELGFEPVPGLQRQPVSDAHFMKNYTVRGKKIISSMVSETARIGGAYIEESVIGPEARIEDGAVIKRSVVLDGAVVRKWASLDGAVVEPYTEVPAGWIEPLSGRRQSDRARSSDGLHYPINTREAPEKTAVPARH